MKPFEILGTLKLSEILDLPEKLGIEPDAHNREFDFRGPSENKRHLVVNAANTNNWHHDTPRWNAILMWANTHPTELRLSDGTVEIPEDNTVVLINNNVVEHRRPNYPEDAERYFGRIGFKDTPEQSEIIKWKKRLSENR